jgi:hypothetical protein
MTSVDFGPFADLVPANGAPPAVAPSGNFGPFSDLVPKRSAKPPAAAPSGGNPFDQFDTPAGNLFDRFDAPNNAAPPTAAPRHKFGLGDTWPAQLIKAAIGAVTLPGDVYAGKSPVPFSADTPSVSDNEANKRALDFASFVPGGTLPRMATRAAVETPTVDALKTAARAGYNDPAIDAVAFRPQAVANLHSAIKSDLERGPNSGFRELNQPATFNAIKELLNPNQSGTIAAGGPIGIADVDAVRKTLGRISQDYSRPSDGAAAARATAHIDNFLTNLKQPDLLSGDADAANTILQKARGNWGAAARATEAQNATGNAEIQAASTGSGRNIGNATRQKFKSALMDDAKRLGGYSPEEIAQREKVVFGSPVGNTARAVANMTGGGGGIGATIAGPIFAATSGDPIGLSSLAIPAVGYAAKKIENASVVRNASKLDDMLRQRSPLFQDALANRPPPAAISPLQANAERIATLRALLAGAGDGQ